MEERKVYFSITLKGFDDGVLHSILSFIWNKSIVQYTKISHDVSGAGSAPVFR
jgi:hypothetical protein